MSRMPAFRPEIGGSSARAPADSPFTAPRATRRAQDHGQEQAVEAARRGG
jgi:hypothetical protein